jgi:hypothetical protein
MAKITHGYIINVVTDGPAFAVISEAPHEDQEVFIPRNLVEKHRLEEMLEVEMLVVKNPLEPHKTPWMARALTVLEDEDESPNLSPEDPNYEPRPKPARAHPQPPLLRR